jgi:hypothetical protein
VEYKKKHGDCEVPQCYKKDPALGHLVDTQKILVRSKVIPEESQYNMSKVALIYWIRLISNKKISPIHMQGGKLCTPPACSTRMRNNTTMFLKNTK